MDTYRFFIFPVRTEEPDNILYYLGPNFIFLGRRSNFPALVQFLNKDSKRYVRSQRAHFLKKYRRGKHYLTQSHYKKTKAKLQQSL